MWRCLVTAEACHTVLSPVVPWVLACKRVGPFVKRKAAAKEPSRRACSNVRSLTSLAHQLEDGDQN